MQFVCFSFKLSKVVLIFKRCPTRIYKESKESLHCGQQGVIELWWLCKPLINVVLSSSIFSFTRYLKNPFGNVEFMTEFLTKRALYALGLKGNLQGIASVAHPQLAVSIFLTIRLWAQALYEWFFRRNRVDYRFEITRARLADTRVTNLQYLVFVSQKLTTIFPFMGTACEHVLSLFSILW